MLPIFFERTAPYVAKAINVFPLAPPNTLLALLVKRMARCHEDILERLKPIAGTTFAVNITDLDLTVLLRPERDTITAQFARKVPAPDVTVAGTLPVLIAMLDGELDGDALFFTRDLSISGNTEALLTLRNALDGGDFNLRQEIIALSGPLAPVLNGVTDAFKRTQRAPESFPAGLSL